MNATEASFEQRAEHVVRDFVRSVLLIDDDWPEAQEHSDIGPAPAGAFVDPSASAVSLTESTATYTAADPTIIGAVQPGDAKRLLRIQKSVKDEGVLFCGVKYPGAGMDQIRKLAARADIVILDWHLLGVSDDGSDALAILKQLHDDNGLHFVCMYTGQGRAADVKASILRRLNAAAEGGEHDFRVANLIVAIRQKPGMTGGPVTAEDEIFDTAVKSIARTYQGYVQLGLLEITNRHREQLPKMLAHLGPDIDAAVIYEATDSRSPVSEANGPFLSMLLDEWRAMLADSMSSVPMRIMSDGGVRAFLKSSSGRPDIDVTTSVEAFLVCALGKTVDPQLQGWAKKSMASDLKEWLHAGAKDLPANVPNGWRKDVEATRWAFLAAALVAGAPIDRKAVFEPLLKVDALFQQQHHLPARLTQGTILRTDPGEYLICVTPLCDAARPDKKINFVYGFLVGEAVDIGATRAMGYGCTVRTKTEHIALSVRLKGQVTLRIIEPSLDAGRALSGSIWFPTRPTAPAAELGEAEVDLAAHDASDFLMHSKPGPSVRLTPVGQLRVDFALALAQVAAAEAMRVGVDRSEFLRTRFATER